jgi:hypothetical protein
LFNDTKLIKEILNNNDIKNIKIFALKEFKPETPNDLMKELLIKNKDFLFYNLEDSKSKIKEDEFIKDLHDYDIRILLTDQCVKITGQEKTIFIFKTTADKTKKENIYYKQITDTIGEIINRCKNKKIQLSSEDIRKKDGEKSQREKIEEFIITKTPMEQTIDEFKKLGEIFKNEISGLGEKIISGLGEKMAEDREIFKNEIKKDREIFIEKLNEIMKKVA